MTLDRAYFEQLGQPEWDRVNHLPKYAQVYIEALKQQAQFWHARRHGTEFRPRIRSTRDAERIAALPIWAQDWIYTLEFEVRWWRDKCRPQPVQQQGRLF